ncbi:MAG: DUF3320 domain-containing protein [Promethearchaeota archaeon]
MPEGGFSDTFNKKFRIWANNLLDLSHKNRALYIKPKARTTLEIIHPPMDYLFEELVINGKEFKFPPVFEPSLHHPKDGEVEESYKARVKDMHQKAIEEMINGKAKKHDLITRIPDKYLERLIKQHRRRAKQAFEEQGINVLYITFGLLKWYENPSGKVRDKDLVYSPLLFVPIELYRKRILDDYKIKILDDDVILNPSLYEKFKSQFNLELPHFPEEFTIEDFHAYLEGIRSDIASNKKTQNWELTDRVFIGLFSFAKATMYTDLIQYKKEMYNNKIIRAIAEGGGYVEDPSHIPGESEYSDAANPINSYHVLDCDSSQMKAIQFAKKGASMVIRGPPGTGKSQVISNIIAECLGANKKVLFVAEKRAALDVVKRRLDKCGIGDFCLELHSDKANKVEILRQIDRSLKSELKEKTYDKKKYKSLLQQRMRLNEYLKNIHEPLGKTGTSLYQRIGEYERLRHIPLIKASIRDPLNITDEQLFKIEDLLAQLEVYKNIIRDYDSNPWKDVEFANYSEELKNEIFEDLTNLIDYSKQISQTLSVIETKFKLKPIKNQQQMSAYGDFFNQFYDSALPLDFTGVSPNMKKKELKNLEKQIQKVAKNFRKGKNVLAYAQAIVDFKEAYLAKPYRFDYSGLEKEIRPLIDLNEKIKVLKAKLKPLFDARVKEGATKENEWQWNVEVADNILSNINSFNEWVSVQIIIQQLNELGLKDFIFQLMNNKDLDPNLNLFDLFRKSYLYAWIQTGMRKFPNLANFNPKYYRDIVKKFKKIDEEIIKINRYRLAKKLFEQRPKPNLLSGSLKSSEYNILMREMMKKRNVKPLRQILALTRNYIAKIKPCFLMSPLSIAKYLPIEYFLGFFDVVIFDEASQVAPEDALGAIIRGKQLIVVGDEKQLPPTSFFSSNLYDSMDDFAADVDTFDSILEECTGIGFPTIMLNYHYRSKKEGLISFSNYHFYDNNLYTFPDLVRKGIENADDVRLLPAVEFHYLPDGIYDKGKTRTNKVEAREVAKAIIQHFINNEKNGTIFSLGVVAFSEAQRNAIYNELEKILKKNPDLEILIHKFDEFNNEPLLIKNLENIQGDERDFIFFSVGFAKDENGNFSLNFGPINKPGGERRLNVAITRARYHVKIFCSFLPYEIDISKTRSAGVHRLFEYLEYARTGTFGQVVDAEKSAGDVLQAQFEAAVIEALEERGYKVEKEVGNSKYKIDIAIVNPEDPNRYLLGITCDGGSYKLIPSVRDRERIRNNILKLLGWEIFHIFAPEWFENREKILKKIDKIIKNKLEEIKREKERKIQALSEEELLQPVAESNDLEVEVIIKDDTAKTTPSTTNSKSAKTTKATKRKSKKASTKKSTKINLRDPNYRKQLLSYPGVKEYKKYDKYKVLDKKYFERAPSRLKAAKEIIKYEGPIHWDLLEKRIKDYFGITRTNDKITDILEEIRDSLPCEGDFYYPKKYDPLLIRIAIDRKDDPRKFEYISDLEIKNVMKLFIQSTFSIDKKDLFKQTVQFFGFPGMRNEWTERMESLLIIANNELKTAKSQPIELPQISAEEGVEAEIVSATNGNEATAAIETDLSGRLIGTADLEINEKKLQEILKEAEEVTEDNGFVDDFANISKDDILDVLSDGQKYTFDELVEELDISSNSEKNALERLINLLYKEGKIKPTKEKGKDAWILKRK